MNDYFAMGGYAAYVWSAYGIFAAVFLINALAACKQGRRIRNNLKKTKKMSSDRQIP